jgi:hypothetical protein
MITQRDMLRCGWKIRESVLKEALKPKPSSTCTPRIRSRVSFSAVLTLRSNSLDMR